MSDNKLVRVVYKEPGKPFEMRHVRADNVVDFQQYKALTKFPVNGASYCVVPLEDENKPNVTLNVNQTSEVICGDILIQKRNTRGQVIDMDSEDHDRIVKMVLKGKIKIA